MTRRTLMTLLMTASLGLMLPAGSLAQDAPPEPPDVDSLLKGLEHNLNFESRTAKITMIIANPRRTRTMEIFSYGRGLDESSMEFLAPAREKGTKMYRKGDEMWMYMPTVERTQKISGHMLRQGMMGSDMSYEDIMGSTNWDEVYDGIVDGLVDYEGSPHWKVVLTAKDDSVTYPKRVTYIDQKTLIPTMQELYALSGMLVKTWGMTDVQEIAGKQYPMTMRIEDKLKAGTYTEIKTSELKFGVEVPEEVFSLRWLERS